MTPFEHIPDALLEVCARGGVDARQMTVTISFATPHEAHRFRRVLYEMQREVFRYGPPGVQGRGFEVNGVRFKLEVAAQEITVP